MPDQAPERPRRRSKVAVADDQSISAATAKADQYIADQLKAMFDAVAVEPVPDRLLQLLDRLKTEPDK
jgi:hypothetical protein